MFRTCLFIVLSIIFLACNLPTNQPAKDISAKVTAEYNLKYKEALDSIEAAKKWIQNGGSAQKCRKRER